MKTKSHIWAAILAAFALNGAAIADHQPGHPAAPAARGSGNNPAAATTDEPSMAWRMARYPGRVGHSIVRTPWILGETFSGKRSFIGERGFFQSTDQAAEAEGRKSVPQGRGQRMAR